MQRFTLHSTIHRATVTAADLNHVGPLVLGRDPKNAAGALPRLPEHVS